MEPAPSVALQRPLLAVPAVGCRAAVGSATTRLLFLPAGWVLTEVLGRLTFLKATWALIGVPLAEWPMVAQAASICGPEALGYPALAVNVAIATWLKPSSRYARALGLLQGPGLLAIILSWGFVHDIGPDTRGPVLSAAVIQPNVPQEFKWDAAQRRSMLAQLDRLIDRTLPDQPDLIVLPETAVTGFVRYENDLADWVKGTVVRVNKPLRLSRTRPEHRRDANL